MDIKVGNHKLDKCFIVAELSCNHLHDYNTAIETIKAAKYAGADAVKLQTYLPDSITIDCDNKYFKVEDMWGGKNLFNVYNKSYTPLDWHAGLKKEANNLRMELFSSSFDKYTTDFLTGLDVPAYKVSSFEITDIPLIKYMASKGKPILISTGIATIEDITDAINACHSEGNNQIILLKCVSEYPTQLEDCNLSTIYDMSSRFGVTVGLSDHTLTFSTAIAAVTLGAKVVEKHLILNRKLGGYDSSFSIEPNEFKIMVDSIREVEKAIGSVHYPNETSKQFSRSLFVIKDINEGDIFTENNIRSIRPGYGVRPELIDSFLGKKANSNIKRGTPLTLDLI